MPKVTDFARTSRFRADPDFSVVTRKGITLPTILMLPVPTRGAEDRLFIVPLKCAFRWDLLALEVLGDVNLKWVLLRHNRIDDPFDGPGAGQRILIPSADQVNYYLNQG